MKNIQKKSTPETLRERSRRNAQQTSKTGLSPQKFSNIRNKVIQTKKRNWANYGLLSDKQQDDINTLMKELKPSKK